MNLSNHGEKRIRKRAGIPKKAAKKLAAQALKEGKLRDEFSGRLRKYLDALYHQGDYKSKIIVYRDYVFIFTTDILVTMWMLHPKYRGRN